MDAIRLGPTKANAEYNCIALAPAHIFMNASAPELTPPTPISGILPSLITETCAKIFVDL